MKKTIMIVEDDPVIRMLLKNIIRRMYLSVEIIECENGQEALDSMDQKINLVFSDNNMPLLSGFELIEKLKNDKRYSSIPVIMVSVEARKEFIHMGMNKGFSDWITKPFQPDQIARCLEKYA